VTTTDLKNYASFKFTWMAFPNVDKRGETSGTFRNIPVEVTAVKGKDL